MSFFCLIRSIRIWLFFIALPAMAQYSNADPNPENEIWSSISTRCVKIEKNKSQQLFVWLEICTLQRQMTILFSMNAAIESICTHEWMLTQFNIIIIIIIIIQPPT